MRCANLRFVWAALLSLILCAGCGGGNSSETTCSGGPLAVAACSGGGGAPVTLTNPATGSNTTEVIVDLFTLGGAANVPYVTVTICPPNSDPASSTGCVTVDHVFLDTGSYGLRLLKSSLVTPGGVSLALPAQTLPANAQFNTPAGTSLECYPFVLGGLWGPVATADVHIAGETASAIPIQLIDDPVNATPEQKKDCISAAGGQPTLDACIAQGGTLATCTNSSSAAIKFLYSTAASLQANGILGIGMMPYDCGPTCTLAPQSLSSLPPGFHIQYYVCPDLLAVNCQPGVVATDMQVQNPVVHFVPDDGNLDYGGQPDNNGTIITMPDPSPIGAGVAKGRLVFGIETRSNNKIDSRATRIMAGAPWLVTASDGTTSPAATCPSDTCPLNPGYLYFTTTVGSISYLDSYIDSGSNAYFFTDSSIPSCTGQTGAATLGAWYCPPGTNELALSATLSDDRSPANPVTVKFKIANSDLLFGMSSNAFNNLGGSMGSLAPRAPQTFVWGLPFFYGRSVYTSIWGQALSPNGSWNAFYVF